MRAIEALESAYNVFATTLTDSVQEEIPGTVFDAQFSLDPTANRHTEPTLFDLLSWSSNDGAVATVDLERPIWIPQNAGVTMIKIGPTPEAFELLETSWVNLRRAREFNPHEVKLTVVD